MGIFDRFKKEKHITIAACTDGRVIPMKEISDPAFSGGFLGFCVGIDPETGNIVSPAAGKITQLSDTLHAVGLLTDEGIELLIHAGIDTVAMGGEGFSASIQPGDRVEAGRLLLTMDREKVRAAGYGTTIVLAVTNSDELGEIRLCGENRIKSGEILLEITEKR